MKKIYDLIQIYDNFYFYLKFYFIHFQSLSLREERENDIKTRKKSRKLLMVTISLIKIVMLGVNEF
jgi:hypothetical protein